MSRFQAVRLPMEFRFDGDSVRIMRVGQAVILEPLTFDTEAWLKALSEFRAEPFMRDGRNQPATPVREIFE